MTRGDPPPTLPPGVDRPPADGGVEIGEPAARPARTGRSQPGVRLHRIDWLASPRRGRAGGHRVHYRPPARELSGAGRDTERPVSLLSDVTAMVVRRAPVPLLVLAVLLWASALPMVDLTRMNDYGLVSVLPARMWVGFAVFMVSFVLAWTRADRTGRLLAVHVLAFIVMFYGIPALVSHSLRGPIVYRHAGITEFLTRTGVVDTRQDAYFSWPAFFMFLSSAVKLGGLGSVLPLGAWATVVVDILYLPPLLLIMQALTRDLRVVWGAVLLFYVANWINQDYLAPQSFTYLFYLAVIALVLRYLRPGTAADLGPPALATRIRRFRVLRPAWPLVPVRPAPAPEGVRDTATGRSAAAVTLVVVLLFGASAASHQLTPYAIFFAITGLVITGHCRARGLPLLFGVILATWTIFVAHGYIDGHLEKITESSGVASSAAANVSKRLAGSPEHLVVVRERLLLSGLVWLLALLGGIRRRRAGFRDGAAIVLAVAPIPLFLLPYGGEVLLRLYFFMLPFVAFFAAALVVGPTRLRWHLPGRRPAVAPLREAVAFGLVGGLLLAGSFVARYGNERMDFYTTDEVAAVQQLYRIAPYGTYLLAETNYLPWKYQDYEWSVADPARRRHRYITLTNEWSLHPERSTRDMVVWASEALRANATLKRPAGYLILTRSQYAHEEILGGLPESTMAEFERILLRSRKFQLVYSNQDAKIYARIP